MFVLKGHFVIGGYRFNAITEIEITHSVDEITDTAIIKMPSKFTIRQNGEAKTTEEAIKVGDPVSITIGYKGSYEGNEFEGYVSRIKYSVPMEIYCEDSLWLLRRKACAFSKKNTNLKEVLTYIVEGTPIKLAANIPDIPLEKFTLKNVNGAQALKYIKDNLAMSIYLNDQGELYCGLEQMNNLNQVAFYDLNYNLVNNDLEFRTANDKQILVVYQSISPDNKKIRVEVGDYGGDKVEVKTRVIQDKAQLEKMAKAHLARLKYDGFDGDITTFLLPYATRGMLAQFKDRKHPGREGKYFIKKVVTTFGMSGARRKITPGNKI